MQQLYDDIGKNYSATRRTDPIIASVLHEELKGAKNILNIGAGCGSYEPENADLTAVEPSQLMISKRSTTGHPVYQGFAETLPFADKSFSHSMTVLSIHHWHDKHLAFEQIKRVTTKKFVALTWLPQANNFWLTRDYFPEIYEIDKSIFPSLNEFESSFNNVTLKPLFIPETCIDGFLGAFWKRPYAYLSPTVRNAMSTFKRIENIDDKLACLEDDLRSGKWIKKNAEILDKSSIDIGYKLIIIEF